ncbi:MAG TPA: pyridoxal phosphate-dependent aminotransferase [Longimicrobium sp.]
MSAVLSAVPSLPLETERRVLGPSARAARLSTSALRRLLSIRREDSVDLSVGEPRQGPSAELLEAGFGAYLREPLGYTIGAGDPELREAVRAHHGFGHVTSVDQVVITVGAMEGLFAALGAVADPGDQVIVVEPNFWCFRRIAEILGIEVVAAPCSPDEGFDLDLNAIAGLIGPRTRAVVLSNPCNPTGRTFSREQVEGLVRVTEASGCWIVADEIYRELFYGRCPTSMGELTDRAIVVGGLSKCCSLMGMRLGWVLSPRALAQATNAIHTYTVMCASSVSQIVAREAFRDPRWLSYTRDELSAKRLLLCRAIDEELGLPSTPSEGSLFVFLDVRGITSDSNALAEALARDAGVVTLPGIFFGQAGEGFLRLSFGATEEHIVEGVRRMRDFLPHFNGRA